MGIRENSQTLEKDFKCDICKFESRFASNLKKHKRTVHDRVKSKCNICFKTFTYLKEHIDAMHKKNKLYICKDCNFSCVRISGLRSHVKRMHNESRVKETCPICFVKCFDIQIHLKKIHENPLPLENEFPCTSCSYKGSKKSYLYSHIKMAHDITFTFCKVCNQEINALKISSHMKKHQENQFSCNPCDKTFRVMRDLARHILYHHKKHRNKCEHCGKVVTSLKKHVKFMHKEVESPVDETHDMNIMNAIKAFLGENVSYNGELDIVTGENYVETNNIWKEDISEEDPLAEEQYDDLMIHDTEDGSLLSLNKNVERQYMRDAPFDNYTSIVPIVIKKTSDEIKLEN